MHELPQDEWVVIFYKQTGATRLCPTLDFAKHTVTSPHMYDTIYKSPGDFRQRHDHHTLENFWRAVYKNAAWRVPKTATGSLERYEETPPDVGTEEFCKLLWQFMQDVGDRLVKAAVKGDQSKDHHEIKLGLIRELIESGEIKAKYNKQASILLAALLDYGKQFLLEDEIKRMILGLVASRELKTKQEPWVVWQYYRPQFIKDGYVLRGKAPRKLRKE